MEKIKVAPTVAPDYYEKQYFDGDLFDFYGGYDKIADMCAWKFRRMKNVINTHTPPSRKHKRLLEIGCAYGNFLTYLKDEYDIHGMDISHHAVKVAASRLKVPFRQGDVLKEIPFDGKFDIIVANDVLEHLHDPERALQVIYDKLNPKGVFYMETPTVNNWLSDVINKLVWSKDKSHVFITNLDHLNSIFARNKFRKITYYSTYLPFFTQIDLIVRSLGNHMGVFQKIE